MKTFTIEHNRFAVRIRRRPGAVGAEVEAYGLTLAAVRIRRRRGEFIAELGEFEIRGGTMTLVVGLLWSTAATVAESVIA